MLLVRLPLALGVFLLLLPLSLCAGNIKSQLVSPKRLSYTNAAEEDRVNALPGWGELDFGMFGGYVTVSETAGRALYYILVESENDPDNDPVILWLNGGPGCSSLGGGFMSEIGPFFPEPDGRTLQRNPYPWNKLGNVLFVESPAFVGFSYSNTSSDAIVGDARTAADSFKFLQGFFERFPHLRDNPFWISGESYAGHYVPNLAWSIVQGNSQHGSATINLQGFFVGNPWTDTYTDNLGAVDFWWHHALISDSSIQGLKENCNFSWIGPLEQHAHHNKPQGKSELCDNYCDQASEELGNINIYQIYADVCLPARVTGPAQQLASVLGGRSVAARSSMLGQRKQRRAARRLSSSSSSSSSRSTPGQQRSGGGVGDNVPADPTYDPCVDNEVEAYLNLPAVQAAIHANQTVKLHYRWTDCTSRIQYSRSDLFSSMLPVYQKLLGRGLKMLIYSGDVDGIVPVVGTRRWVAGLGLKEELSWRAWESNRGQVGGYVVHYEGGMVFSSVRNAGHMVPYTQAERAFTMVKRFLTRHNLL